MYLSFFYLGVRKRGLLYQVYFHRSVKVPVRSIFRVEQTFCWPCLLTKNSQPCPFSLCEAKYKQCLWEWLLPSSTLQPSLDDLAIRFRPNFIVDGNLDPFVEETWTHVEIGGHFFQASEHDKLITTNQLFCTTYPHRWLANAPAVTWSVSTKDSERERAENPYKPWWPREEARQGVLRAIDW